ncbi:hypothetical protein E0H88_03360 [Acinetobacter sp. ANC 4216]|uniref:WbqC family protein n=1 Tax=Acinetobacter sp. ANC 4216 TaxID=2529840 RepID=UPI00103A90F0|nr:WbqC family protein [Acinetobacter sp. ANC 4216]RZJ22733.1 MAG: hypothetical protein EON51_06135 [Acinetobacter sp.]TCB72049.1 hypothetical protein E0H88_03360 [Acinetobacter sp. ANC 4216]
MILSAHQPAYLPWLGYFEKIALSDVFIYMDNVQYEKNSFINRNYIKTPFGKQLLTIPVHSNGHLSKTILEINMVNNINWREKHIRSICQNYSKVKDFKKKEEKIKKLINIEESTLAEYCFLQLKFWIDELGLKTKVIRLSDINIQGKKSDLILELCKKFDCTEYLSGQLGKNYLIESDFTKENILIKYQDYQERVYDQHWGDFIPNLSIVDAWMNDAPIHFLRR